MAEESSDLPLLQLESILPVSDGWLRCSTLCLLGTLSVLAGMLPYLKVDQTVRGQGIIRPSQPYAVVTTPEDAILSAVHVNENEPVVTNQALVDLRLGEELESIVATQDGIAFQIMSDFIGKVMPAGTPIMQIVPESPELTVKLQVEPHDIAQLAVGQPVKARISAYPYPEYGVLDGYVETIAPDVTTCNTCASGYGYVVQVELPKDYMQRQQQRYPLVSGMDVTADIVTHRTRLLSIILNKLRLTSDM